MDLLTLYRDVVETSPDGIWVFDLDGRTLFANPALARLHGVSREEFADLTVFDTLDEEGRTQFARHLELVRAGQFNDREVETQFMRRDGSTFWVTIQESPLRAADGDLVGIVHRVSDYSDRQQMLEDLRTSRARLTEAQQIARVGSWDWDVDADEVRVSAGLSALYGLDPDAFPVRYVDFLALVHPDEQTDVDAAVQAALAGTGEFVFVARLRGNDSWVWTRGRGVVHRDDGGRTRMSGTHQDISETQEAHQALEDQVAQNALMRAVAVAANEARTLADVLQHARSLVLLHDDWERGRAFVPTPDGDGVVPLYVDEAERLADRATPEHSRLELDLANEAHRRGASVWDDGPRLTIAFPVRVGDEVRAVLAITSAPPLYRHDMIQQMVEQVAVQIGRVAEREQAERELADARDQAMEASRQKSEFLATMSHEIRTPLNGVLGLNDLLLRSSLSPEQLRLASGVQVAGRALLGVINDVLDFSKIEAGKLELEVLDFEVRAWLDQVSDVLAPSARTKGLRLLVRCDEDVPRVLAGDPTRLAQVLTNLLSNAVKFTKHGEVSVHTSTRPGPDPGAVVLHVEVADSGVGVAPTKLGQLFDPFTQADASTTRVYGGTGLGLAISREIVTALGGELTYAARPGGGSVFSFTAVLHEATGPLAEGDPTRTWVSGAPTAASSPAAAGPRRRVLVVEDNPVNQMVAQGLLEALGYAVQTADDGVVALEVLRDDTFEAVLMDVQMPRLDGYDTTRRLRLLEDGARRTPVIAMTAAAVEGERERCLAAGMDDFLTKPVDPAALASVLARWVEAPQPAPATHPSEEPVDPTPTPETGLDLERLEMLRDLDPGNTTYLDRAIGNFLANSVGAVGTIRATIEAQDPPALRAAAHKLAGGALNLGVPYAGEAARALEALADTGTTVGAEDLLPALEESLERGRQELLDYQASYS